MNGDYCFQFSHDLENFGLEVGKLSLGCFEGKNTRFTTGGKVTRLGMEWDGARHSTALSGVALVHSSANLPKADDCLAVTLKLCKGDQKLLVTPKGAGATHRGRWLLPAGCRNSQALLMSPSCPRRDLQRWQSIPLYHRYQ